MATDNLAELKQVLGTGKALLGTSRTLKEIRRGNIERVFVSKNTPKLVREDLKHYSDISGFEVVELDIPNDELGTVCRKQFSVSIVSVIK